MKVKHLGKPSPCGRNSLACASIRRSKNLFQNGSGTAQPRGIPSAGILLCKKPNMQVNFLRLHVYVYLNRLIMKNILVYIKTYTLPVRVTKKVT